MTCGSVMTRNPSCCLAGDSVSTAARIMKQQDVGPVLVISDHTDNHLLGIVTDRDIAVNVVAEGRDPYSTRVDSVMTTDPVICHPEDDVSEAVKIMSEYQVRRVPVVDDNECVVGIISQADIARQSDEGQTGEMVEEISQPWGMGEWPNGEQDRSARQSRSSGLDPVSAVAVGALCVGFGAGLMYLFDPKRGRRRRAELTERGADLWNQRGELVHRAQGLIDTAKSKVTGSSSSMPQQTGNPDGGPAAQTDYTL